MNLIGSKHCDSYWGTYAVILIGMVPTKIQKNNSMIFP